MKVTKLKIVKGMRNPFGHNDIMFNTVNRKELAELWLDFCERYGLISLEIVDIKPYWEEN